MINKFSGKKGQLSRNKSKRAIPVIKKENFKDIKSVATRRILESPFLI